MEELDIQRIDFHQLSQKEFIQKYPQYSIYKLHKLFWFKDRKKLIELTEKQARQKAAINKFNEDLERVITENEEKVMKQFNISRNEVKQLTNSYTFSEIIKSWVKIDWKVVVKDLIKVVKHL